MPIERKKIVKPYLLLCEGRDAENFLINYLESEALAQDQRFSNEIQVLDFGGNDDLDRFLMNLKNMERFDQVTSIAIIRDAEKDFAKACSDVTRSLRKSGIISPDSYGTCSSEYADHCTELSHIYFKKAGPFVQNCIHCRSALRFLTE